MIRYTLNGKKPTTWEVSFDGRDGCVDKCADGAPVGKRWSLYTDGERTYHKSRRAAFYFFEYGKPFTVNPVYSKSGRNQGQRLR